MTKRVLSMVIYKVQESRKPLMMKNYLNLNLHGKRKHASTLMMKQFTNKAITMQLKRLVKG